MAALGTAFKVATWLPKTIINNPKMSLAAGFAIASAGTAAITNLNFGPAFGKTLGDAAAGIIKIGMEGIPAIFNSAVEAAPDAAKNTWGFIMGVTEQVKASTTAIGGP